MSFHSGVMNELLHRRRKVKNIGWGQGLEYWGGANSQQAHDVVMTTMRRNDVASMSFRRHVPTRFLINQCQIITFLILKSGPGCSKLTTSLVNVSLKFQTLITEIYQYFLFVRSFCSAKASHIFQQKISVYLVIMIKS